MAIGAGFLVLLSGCATAPPSPPAPSVIEASGIATGETVTGTDRTFTLADGRTFDVPTTVRSVFRGGAGDLFILGSNDAGNFVALFVRQDGLPADCHLPGIGATGIERGGSIEISGVLWPKAGSFRSGQSIPAVGSAYPSSTRFCFNEQGQVAYTVPQ